ncbi:spore germination protein [Oceanobacillus sp. CFH 90083]|uniref:spore germination protein n=1 Tax=Oceanobacillus sp. CFH 90083 TaxID=2592336 RepID=UPI00128C8D41|nr:spore germination protein [Oceanobacillus sp. CFH 90083]
MSYRKFLKKMNRKEQSQDLEKDDPKSIDTSLTENLNIIKEKTGNSPDIIIRIISFGHDPKVRTAIIYADGLVDNPTINEYLVESMENNVQEKLHGKDPFTILSEKVVALGSVKTAKDWDSLFQSLLSGDTVILMDGKNEALIGSTKGGERRSIEQPDSEVSIRGSKEGFTESIATNISLVRRIINNPNLWVEPMNLGKQTKTDVSIMYINGIADNDTVEEVRHRLRRVNLDSILDSGYIEQVIEDESIGLFPTIIHTERPDAAAGNLLEGRIAIFVNGSPNALIVPAVMIQFFQTPEDYYMRFPISTFIRQLRVLMYLISLIGPALYVAITTYHQEMIPTGLLIIIASQTDSVPFPAIVEALIMEVTFEILREAGLRMPNKISSTISIVGALVIGQGAIQAGIVSPAMVIVVSVTAIASLATPSYDIAISARLIRFAFMLSAAIAGFYGIILGLIMLTVHLVSLRSFGVPYISPLAPFEPGNIKDTILRAPLWALNERPKFLSAKNRVRQGKNQRPQVPMSQGMVRADTKEGDKNEF